MYEPRKKIKREFTKEDAALFLNYLEKDNDPTKLECISGMTSNKYIDAVGTALRGLYTEEFLEGKTDRDLYCFGRAIVDAPDPYTHLFYKCEDGWKDADMDSTVDFFKSYSDGNTWHLWEIIYNCAELVPKEKDPQFEWKKELPSDINLLTSHQWYYCLKPYGWCSDEDKAKILAVMFNALKSKGFPVYYGGRSDEIKDFIEKILKK